MRPDLCHVLSRVDLGVIGSKRNNSQDFEIKEKRVERELARLEVCR